jgi:hypothetical protein
MTAFGLLVLTIVAGGFAADATSYGEGAGEGELTSIAEIVATPERFEGREVRVQGEVTGVCQMMGCWMELESGGATVRIKVEDGVIVFPAEALGSRAVARGTVQLLEMSRDEYAGWLRHQAEEQGHVFDEDAIGDPPYRVVQIAGLGAEIE